MFEILSFETPNIVEIIPMNHRKVTNQAKIRYLVKVDQNTLKR